MSVPTMLLRCPNWVNWVLTADGRKLPISPYTGRAAFTGPRAESRARYDLAAARDPVRLGLDIDAPFLGVDLDKVVNENVTLTQRGQKLLAALPPTYTELSPSNTGLHLWYRMRLASDHAALPNAANGDHIEIYSRLRWFTFTGRPVNAIQQVSPLTPALAQSIFALGKTISKPRDPKRIAGRPGRWSTAALEAFLLTRQVEHRLLRKDEFRVRCPGTLGWPQGVTHDDDGLRSNATCVTVLNGHPVFHCHHAKCADKHWRDFRHYYDPGSDFLIDRWIMQQWRQSL